MFFINTIASVTVRPEKAGVASSILAPGTTPLWELPLPKKPILGFWRSCVAGGVSAADLALFQPQCPSRRCGPKDKD